METTEKFLGGKDRTRRKREEASRQGAMGVEKGQGRERSIGQAAEREIKAQERHRKNRKTEWREDTIPLEMPPK